MPVVAIDTSSLWFPAKINDVLKTVSPRSCSLCQGILGVSSKLENTSCHNRVPGQAQWGASPARPRAGPARVGAADRTERTRAVTERPNAHAYPTRQAKAGFASTSQPGRPRRASCGPHTAFAPAPAASKRATGGSAGRRRRRRGRTGSGSTGPRPPQLLSGKSGPRASTFWPYLRRGPGRDQLPHGPGSPRLRPTCGADR